MRSFTCFANPCEHSCKREISHKRLHCLMPNPLAPKIILSGLSWFFLSGSSWFLFRPSRADMVQVLNLQDDGFRDSKLRTRDQ